MTSGTLSTTGNITGGANISGANFLVNGIVSAVGNITGGNLSVVSNVTGGNLNLAVGINSTGTLTITTASNGNVAITPNGTGILTVSSHASVTGNVTAGNVTTAGVLTVNSGNASVAIVNGGGNAVGTIGSPSSYFNKVYAQSTSALYADLAENYQADSNYEPGTVLCFGGPAEVTQCEIDACPAVAGVVSTNPAYQMNTGLTGDNVVAVALIGRVPCKVLGPVKRGAMMVSAGNGHARVESTPAMGTVIGKALEDFDGDFGIIEIVVGRL